MYDQVAAAKAANTKLTARLAEAKAGSGYLTVYLGGTKVHAADREARGHSGFNHPRARCQTNTPRSYASDYGDAQGAQREVTCLRCLASLEARTEV